MIVQQCVGCQGFVPFNHSKCPNCDQRQKGAVKRIFKRLSQMIMGTGFMVTLAACYGAPDDFLSTIDRDADEPCTEAVIETDEEVKSSEKACESKNGELCEELSKTEVLNSKDSKDKEKPCADRPDTKEKESMEPQTAITPSSSPSSSSSSSPSASNP